jgi:hypothetical protein
MLIPLIFHVHLVETVISCLLAKTVIHDEAIIKNILTALSPRELQVLVRLYVLEQDVAQVSRAMSLGESEIRELKSRVKREWRLASKKE